MKTLVLFLTLTTSALATPCDDAKRDFNRAKAFGATNFKCTDTYEGASGASWNMELEQYKKFIESELQRQRQRIKGAKK